MSSLRSGYETNAGLTYRILRAGRSPAAMTLHYEAGVQWTGWRDALNVIEGRGINKQIQRVYGVLATRYRPGDRIFLFGYSRGAYAARSLAGLIDMVGLLRAEEATERNLRDAYRIYQTNGDPVRFAAAHCHQQRVEIEMIGVWDTVKALGLRAPIVWRYSEHKHKFHNHALGPSVRNGYHALAFHENRAAYLPVLWTSDPNWKGQMVQMWFPGTHGDIGGQLNGYVPARKLSNLPLVWMLDQAADLGLALPEGWREGFPRDGRAPSAGNWRGLAALFLARKRRVAGFDPSEKFHAALFKEDGSVAMKRGAARIIRRL